MVNTIAIGLNLHVLRSHSRSFRIPPSPFYNEDVSKSLVFYFPSSFEKIVNVIWIPKNSDNKPWAYICSKGRNSAFQSLKHFENSSKQLALTVHGLIFRRAYYRKDIYVSDLGGLFSGGLIFGGLIIGILRCFIQVESIIGSFLQWNLDRFNEPLYNEVLAIGI